MGKNKRPMNMRAGRCYHCAALRPKARKGQFCSDDCERRSRRPNHNPFCDRYCIDVDSDQCLTSEDLNVCAARFETDPYAYDRDRQLARNDESIRRVREENQRAHEEAPWLRRIAQESAMRNPAPYSRRQLKNW